MDITTLAMYLTGGSLVATLVTGILKSALKKVSDKWGAIATQIVLLAVCLLLAFLFWSSQFVPSLYLMTAGAIFAGAITLYEVFYKAIYVNIIKSATNTDAEIL